MRRMTLLAVAVSIIVPSMTIAQKATDRTAAQNQIVANEKAIMEAIVRNDPKTFHSYVIPDSFALGGTGVMKVADFDKMMSQMKTDCKVTKHGLTESMFYWLNDNAVVHMYKATMEGTCQGQPLPAAWCSSIWTNRGGKWLGAFHQETEVASQPASAPKK